MSIAERNELALAYIEKCERRRQRNARRRQREALRRKQKIDQFLLFAEPIAGIVCVLWFALALI